MFLNIVILLILAQACFLTTNINEVRKAIVAASDLNLEALQRLDGRLVELEHHLSQMPKIRSGWDD